MYVCIYTYIFIHIHTYMRIYLYIYACTKTVLYYFLSRAIPPNIFLYVTIHTYVYTYIHIYEYVYIYIYMHEKCHSALSRASSRKHMYVCIYTYIFIHIHTYMRIYLYIYICTKTVFQCSLSRAISHALSQQLDITRKTPSLYRSFPAKEPYISWLFCGKRPAI